VKQFVAASGVESDRVSFAFQSRLGVDAWLEPATHGEIVRLASSGVRKLTVICPAFTVDCLETLEEIGMRAKVAFLAAGGEQFTLIPCLNDHPAWIDGLARITSCSAS
jgi:ferrochelatase